jgi:Fe-S-cluster containining protein
MLTDELCTRCGLCCDGTLFGDVELTGCAESARLELLGLDVDGDDADVELLALPCAALTGTRCRIYPQRPQCCRTFTCRLLDQAERGAVTLDEALTRIARARSEVQHVEALLAALGVPRTRLPLKERCSDALDGATDGPEAATKYAALDAAMAAVSITVRTVFLD